MHNVKRALRKMEWEFFADVRASYTPKEAKDLLSQSKLQNRKIMDYFFWLSIFSGE